MLYKNSKSAVMVDGNLSDPFDVTTGVLQGDVLAPFLLVVLVDYLLKKATSQLDSGVVTHPCRSRRHSAKSCMIWILQMTSPCLNPQAHKHKPSLPKQQKHQLTLTLSSVHQRECACELQPTGSPSSLWRSNHVSDFRYLGSMVASGSNDLKRRKSLVWCAFWKLYQLWKSPHIPIATKVKLFSTTCVTRLLYGCDSWVIFQDMENKIRAFATSCYRVMLNIKRIDHVLNTTVYSMTNSLPLIVPG